jgi:hypothetical protein
MTDLFDKSLLLKHEVKNKGLYNSLTYLIELQLFHKADINNQLLPLKILSLALWLYLIMLNTMKQINLIILNITLIFKFKQAE